MSRFTQIKLWPKIVYDNITYIVVGIVAFSLFWTLALRLFYHYMPPRYFVRNITATVYPTQAHKDVYVRVCRDRRGDFTAKGIRTIYSVPEGKTVEDGQQVARYTIPAFAIDGGRCDNTTLYRSDYDFNAGDYYFRTSIDVTVPYGEVKTYTYTSNKFTIFPVQTSDVQGQIDNLQKEIERLRNIINLDPTSSSIQSSTSSQTPVAVVPSNQNSQTQQPAQSTNGNTGSTSQQTDPIPNQCVVNFTVPLIGTKVKAIC